MSTISHLGTILAINNNSATVGISRTEACHSCDLKHSCMLLKQQRQIDNVPLPLTHHFHVGEQVELSLSAKTCWNSIIIGYVLPLLVMISTAVALHLLGGSDSMAALCSLLSLIPYYIIVYLFSRHCPPQVEFHIRQINSGCNPEK